MSHSEPPLAQRQLRLSEVKSKADCPLTQTSFPGRQNTCSNVTTANEGWGHTLACATILHFSLKQTFLIKRSLGKYMCAPTLKIFRSKLVTGVRMLQVGRVHSKTAACASNLLLRLQVVWVLEQLRGCQGKARKRASHNYHREIRSQLRLKTIHLPCNWRQQQTIKCLGWTRSNSPYRDAYHSGCAGFTGCNSVSKHKERK